VKVFILYYIVRNATARDKIAATANRGLDVPAAAISSSSSFHSNIVACVKLVPLE
jgi:hypothetical protein